MRVGAIVRSYGLTTYLPAVLRSYAWVEKIVVMNYCFKGVTPRPDDTASIVAGFKNAELKTGEGLDQHHVLNLGLEQFDGFDWVFIADNDELFTRADQDKLLEGVQGYSAGKCNIVDYARDFYHAFPMRSHQPIVIAKPSVRFYEVRCFVGNIKSFDDVYIHHLGYVYSPEDMAWKINWEKPWEHDTVVTLLGKVPVSFSMPDEISELISG